MVFQKSSGHFGQWERNTDMVSVFCLRFSVEMAPFFLLSSMKLDSVRIGCIEKNCFHVSTSLRHHGWKSQAELTALASMIVFMLVYIIRMLLKSNLQFLQESIYFL